MLFSWVHLSDIHIGHGDAEHGWDQALVLDALQRDIATVVARGDAKPDVVLVTGDVAFSGADRARTPTEYVGAREWLLAVAKAAEVRPDRVFVVPGNHDVQRSADKDRAVARMVKALRDGSEALDGALADANERVALAGRMANYLDFASDFAPACLGVKTPPEKRFWWTHREVSRGLKVRLVGLNTALLCADDQDRGKLRVGKDQVSNVLLNPPLEEGELVVVLSHHPFSGGWLADERNVREWMRSRAHVHLSGHVHEADAEQTRSGAGEDIVSVVAGAVHGERSSAGLPPSHGYSFASIHKAPNGGLFLRMTHRKWTNSQRAFRLDTDHIPDGAKHAEFTLGLSTTTNHSLVHESTDALNQVFGLHATIAPATSKPQHSPELPLSHRQYNRNSGGTVILDQFLRDRLLSAQGTGVGRKKFHPDNPPHKPKAVSKMQLLALDAASRGMSGLVEILKRLHGCVLDGRFRIRALHKIGSQFVVFQGQDLVREMPVAIKLSLLDYTRPTSFGNREVMEGRAAVVREWKILRQYSAGSGILPNDIALIIAPNELLAGRASGISDGEHFLVEEWVDGSTLDDLRQTIASDRERSSASKTVLLEDVTRELITAVNGLSPNIYADVASCNFVRCTNGRIRVVDAGGVVSEGTRLWDALSDDSSYCSLCVPITMCYLPADYYASYQRGIVKFASWRLMMASIGRVLHELTTNLQPLEGIDPSPDSLQLLDVSDRLRRLILTLLQTDGEAMRTAINEFLS